MKIKVNAIVFFLLVGFAPGAAFAETRLDKMADTLVKQAIDLKTTVIEQQRDRKNDKDLAREIHRLRDTLLGLEREAFFER
ncbi:MAG: hypothetical protein KJ950_05905 [Proteobacteria bacterium]|nr:hypothetical protein [Pseudomonadota bacterium]MBU1685745.1 hypothetical protein [Pseudomonadota bacterium]